MANELVIHHPTGATLYALLFDATGQIYNGSTFGAPSSASWTDYDIAMSEAATATGIYRADMPAVAAGAYGWVVRKQAGGSPAVTDITVGAGSIRWTGTAEETVPAAVNVTYQAGVAVAAADASGNVPAYLADRAHGGSAATITAKKVTLINNEAYAKIVEISNSEIGGVGIYVNANQDIVGDLVGAVESLAVGAQQDVRDAMKLAPTAGDPAAGSIDAHLDDIVEDTGTTLPGLIVGSGTYSYSNTVDDGSGNLLDGVRVELATDIGFTNIVSATHTDSEGAFTVYSDLAGTHYLRLQLAGYAFTIQTVVLA